MLTAVVRRSLSHPVTILATAAALVVGPAAAQVRPDTLTPVTFGPADTPRCLKCHGMANLAVRDSAGAPLHSYSVSPDGFKGSVHGRLECQQCHAEIARFPHNLAGRRARVSCAADCHATDSTGNAYSHDKVVEEFRGSIHRKGLTDAPEDSPTCLSCHGEGNPHGIARADRTMRPAEKMALCVSCHADSARMNRHGVDPGAVTSYRRSFHYKAIRFGQTNTAVCQDCHTVHHVLPKDSAGSSIGVARIAQTCGQEQCHPGARMNFAMSGANHLSLRVAREPVLWWLEKFFLVLTAGTMAMLVVGIILDVQRSFGWGRLLSGVTARLRGGWRWLLGQLPGAWRLARRVLVD